MRAFQKRFIKREGLTFKPDGLARNSVKDFLWLIFQKID